MLCRMPLVNFSLDALYSYSTQSSSSYVNFFGLRGLPPWEKMEYVVDEYKRVLQNVIH